MAIENIMNDKVKKVLSYIGVACLGAFIGMGALIGVSSCSKQDNQQQLKAKVNKKSSFYDADKYYYLKQLSYLKTAYNQNQTGNIYLQQSILQEDLLNYVANVDYRGTFVLSDQPNKTNSMLRFSFYLNKVDNDTATMQLFSLTFWGGTRGQNNIYALNSNYSEVTLLVADITSIINTNEQYFYESSPNAIFNFYYQDLGKPISTFEFAKQINYNAPYGWDISSTFINDSYFDSSHLAKVITYDMPLFLSGGFVFDQIKVYFMNAQATSYIDSEGNRQVFGSDSFCYYQQMEYVNSRASTGQVVNKRDFLAWSSGNSSGFSVTRSSNWLSNDFQKLEFFEELTPQARLNLNQFNNNQYGDSFAIAQNNDIGLGNVFNLLTMAFSSWLPILSIQIIPGITIGLLMFIPLIAGIIILVIWIVKR